MATKWDPVAYSPSTRKAVARTWEQISLTQSYVDGTLSPDSPRRLIEYAKIVGLAISLSNLAEQHRQWGDFERYQAVQGRYARLMGDLEREIRSGRVA